jgi:hypothetical protein
MAKKNQRGSKAQRQNQHVRRLMMKIERHKKRGWQVSGLEKELAYCVGDADRPSFQTGRVSDLKYRNFKGEVKEL